MRINESKEHSGMLRRPLVTFEILKRAGHAEMQSQPKVSITADKQMFAMSAAGFETASFQSPCQLTLRDTLQNIRVPHIDTDDPLMQRRRVKVSLESLDIGQLWHHRLRELLKISLQWQRAIVFSVLRALSYQNSSGHARGVLTGLGNLLHYFGCLLRRRSICDVSLRKQCHSNFHFDRDKKSVAQVESGKKRLIKKK